MEGKKLKSLLKFYKKKGVKVFFNTKMNGGTEVKGKILNLNLFFRGSVVLKDGETLVKIFLEDILDDSILPMSFLNENKEKKEKYKDKRDPISAKTRFDVFRRDKFVCQYCGACGPNVELEVDHVIPVSRGGSDDVENLKTSCFECNRGKGGRV